MGNPILYIVIPCYNEEAVLPLTSGMFLKKIKDLAAAGKISDKSRILFVNDGSKDKTWDIIRSLAEADEHYRGVCLSRNRGHQNALLAGLMTAKDLADATISIDCDGQDDIHAMDAMIDEYLAGMLVSAVSFVAIIVTLITKLVGFTVTGWTSMICAIYFLGGVQLLGIGVIGEYVGKIYNETKARPRFIISETTFEKEKP